MSGQIIALKNRDLKTLILYPRGDPFYSRLSGTITAKPREAIVETSTDLQSGKEIIILILCFYY